MTIGYVNNVIQEQNGANLTIINNTFDGLNMTQMNQFITLIHGGVLTVEYCWFKNSQAQIVSALCDQPVTLVYKYNLIDDINTHFDGAHANWLQAGANPSSVTLNVSFNTGVQFSLRGAEAFQMDSPGPMPSPILANNTIIALPNLTGVGASIGVGPQTMSYCIQGSVSNTISGIGTNANNYYDLSGAFGAYYPASMTPAIGWTSSNNRNMTTGGIITPA